MRILVVDDEERARAGIVQVVKLYCKDVQTILEADGLKAAKEILENEKLDAILLDIQLKDGNGFELTKKIGELNIPLIFITAHEEYAIKAFKISAMNYLLKPIDPDELIQTLEKIALQRQKKNIEEKLSVFLEYSLKQTEAPKRIVLRTSESIHVVETKDIVYCEADKNYTTFHLVNHSKILVSGNIGEYEELLHSDSFLRIHQSFLFNLTYIERFEKGEGGLVITKTGSQLPVSSRKKDQLMQYLNKLR
jgi:two-component system, LytTR family, response regulator